MNFNEYSKIALLYRSSICTINLISRKIMISFINILGILNCLTNAE